ncbi:Pyruvate phosphate dikinase, PEP/pyruvate binding domain [Mariprofundus ferrinatatus]|uniref:Pyruvate phosphate dikinase, PEP/pyruvate binding domain n=2 Tax=Mariprofundus ferrinatatus TaxID=1921087 RepID=A0A2K8L4U7_9PROT|nr:Pyruvate phosphate dikinase, PEP/pyruvate binding domain [Mariprofundus ferrinatatus]
MRANGYLIANLVAGLNPEDYIGLAPKLDEFKQVLLERYLIRADDGWVFRRARYYRGAIQVEDEQVAANKIVTTLLDDPAWTSPERYLLLRETVRLLPLAVEPQLGAKIRQAATEISEEDEGFYGLRIKIHSMPDAADPQRVRTYALKSGLGNLQGAYESLAADMDALYAPHTAISQLNQLAEESWNRRFKQEMLDTVEALGSARGAAETIAVAASRSQRFRSMLQKQNRYTVHNRLRFLRASLVLEQEIYARGNQLLETPGRASRSDRLSWLRHLAAAVHATGLISDRQWRAVRDQLDRLIANDSLTAAEYYRGLRYVARMTQWSQRAMEYHFATTVERWGDLSELVQNYVPDRVRSSPLLPFTRVLDTLIADAGQLSGIRHTVFGREVATGVRGLNPGLQRGVLLLDPEQGGDLRSDGIYILQSTRQELTPVAGIITRGEGSSMSHVQLLARNMGIPNLVVDERLYRRIKGHVGERIVVAISHQGVVSIEQDSPKWEAVFGTESPSEMVSINADMDKLDLNDTALKSLGSIRSRDSGRTVGPKAANLGELHHFYPQMVNPGIVIPFGFFKQHLEQPLFDGGPSVLTWIKSEYDRLALVTDGDQKSRETQLFLDRLRKWIVNSSPDNSLKNSLRNMLNETFGDDGSYGVFVRSDTNVEDLPGFSGAGLNLTVANVVGFDAILKAILHVWASPFSDRSHAWRQSYMEEPEHVYPAVLLMKSFPSEKSGVLVSAAIESGDRSLLSVAVNEGIGGAVEGQAAEEIRVERISGGVELIAQASSPVQKVLNPEGGLQVMPASGKQSLLSSAEIEQLLSLIADVERRFPLPRNAQGVPVVADIEFGFRQGKLALFQIRPFVESSRARSSQTLIDMDRDISRRGARLVQMNRPPLVSELL